MYIPDNRRITTLDELIDECKQIYTGWCFRGKKDLSLTSYTGKYNTQYWSTFYDRGLGDKYNLSEICNPATNTFVGLNFLWLRYDSKASKVSIYRRIMRDTKEGFLSMKTKYRPCNIRISDFNNFCSNCGLNGEVLLIRVTHKYADPPILPFARTSETCVCGEVFAISGTIADFANAGWQEEYDRIMAKEENSRRVALEQGRRKISLVIPLADKLYHSKLMEEIGIGQKSADPYLKMHLTTLGIYFESRKEDWDYEPLFLFSQHGYRNIATKEEFIAFIVAYVCTINHTPPSDLELEKINWIDEIRHEDNGTMYIREIDLPSYPFPENTQEKLSTPTLKDLLD